MHWTLTLDFLKFSEGAGCYNVNVFEFVAPDIFREWTHVRKRQENVQKTHSEWAYWWPLLHVTDTKLGDYKYLRMGNVEGPKKDVNSENLFAIKALLVLMPSKQNHVISAVEFKHHVLPPPCSTQAPPLTWISRIFSCCCGLVWPRQSHMWEANSGKCPDLMSENCFRFFETTQLQWECIRFSLRSQKHVENWHQGRSH